MTYPEIDPSDIKAGDLIRCEWPKDEVFAVEYKADCDRDSRPTATVHRLINRPAPIIHAKGKTLYFKEARSRRGITIGDTGTVARDYREGDRYCHVVHDASGYRDGYPLDLIEYLTADRPVPPVELPSVPTLGWATRDSGDLGGTELAVWHHTDIDGSDGGWLRRPISPIDDRDVTAFVPATAVPTSALDELLAAQEKAFDATSDTRKNDIRRDAIEALLAAVGKDNEAQS